MTGIGLIAVAVLAGLMSPPPDGVMDEMVRDMARNPPRMGVNLVIRRLNDPDPAVRRQAAVLLGQIHQSIERALRQTLTDGDADVRSAAVEGLLGAPVRPPVARAATPTPTPASDARLRIETILRRVPISLPTPTPASEPAPRLVLTPTTAPKPAATAPKDDVAARKKELKTKLVDMENDLSKAQESQKELDEAYKRDSEAWSKLKKEADDAGRNFKYLEGAFIIKEKGDLEKN